MSEQLGWKIWYDNGKTFSSAEGIWCNAPKEYIAGVVTYYTDGTRIIHHADYYFEKGGEVFSCNAIDLEKHLKDMLPQLKYGKWMNTEVFERAQKEMQEAKELS